MSSDIKGPPNSYYSPLENWLGSFKSVAIATSPSLGGMSNEQTLLPVHTNSLSSDLSTPTVSEKDQYTKSSASPEITSEVKEPTTVIGRGIRYALKHPRRAIVYGLAGLSVPVGLGVGLPLGLRHGSEKVAETVINDVCGFEKPFETGIKAVMTASDGSCPRLHKDFSDPGNWERISVIDSKTGKEVTLGSVQKAASWENGRWNYDPSPNATLYSGGWTLENLCLKGDWGSGKNPHTIGPVDDWSYYYVPNKKFDSGNASLFIDEKGGVHNNPNPDVQYRVISTLGNMGNKTLQQVIDSASGLQNLTDNQASLARFADLQIPSPCKGQKLRRQKETNSTEAHKPYYPPLHEKVTSPGEQTRKPRRAARRGQSA